MTFATEQDVRDEANLYDLERIPSERVLRCLARAHADILAGTTLEDGSTPDERVHRAETLLALSHLAKNEGLALAITGEAVQGGAVRVDEPARAHSLTEVSQRLWREAWNLLRPYARSSAPPPLILAKGATR